MPQNTPPIHIHHGFFSFICSRVCTTAHFPCINRKPMQITHKQLNPTVNEIADALIGESTTFPRCPLMAVYTPLNAPDNTPNILHSQISACAFSFGLFLPASLFARDTITTPATTKTAPKIRNTEIGVFNE